MFSFFSFSLSFCLQQFLIKCLRQMSSWLFKNVPVPICTYASIDECTLLRTQMLALFHWPFCCFFCFCLPSPYWFILLSFNITHDFSPLCNLCIYFFIPKSIFVFSCSFKTMFDLFSFF